MSLAELLPVARALTPDEKRSLIRVLSEDLAKDDPLALLPSGVEFPVWSPLVSFEAGAQLQQLLDKEREES